jgi:F0F1-type ATP synthase membrane subunit b/b'
MELATIVELIPTLGFPIVLVLAMGWFIWKIYNQSVEREKTLMTEIAESRTINAQFAEIIAQYKIEIGEIKTDVKEIKTVLIKTE